MGTAGLLAVGRGGSVVLGRDLPPVRIEHRNKSSEVDIVKERLNYVEGEGRNKYDNLKMLMENYRL